MIYWIRSADARGWTLRKIRAKMFMIRFLVVVAAAAAGWRRNLGLVKVNRIWLEVRLETSYYWTARPQ